MNPVSTTPLVAGEGLAVCDAVLTEVCFHSERDTRLTVWTYDREFRTTWRRPNGTVIPMAVK
jgi:hypothetical protein